jgi:heme/copper-type cytochrome/quinol oxidase subunit 3
LPEDVLPYRRPHRQVPDGREHVVSPKTQLVGMWLFLLGLVLVFASGMLIYVIARWQMRDVAPLGDFRSDMLNMKLIASTAIVLLASFAIHQSLKAVKRERIGTFLRWLWITNLLATGFVAVQTPAMIDLLSRDTDVVSTTPAASPFTGGDPTVADELTPRDLLPAERGSRLYAILFVFVLIHALHVLGGMIYLAIVTLKGHKGYYDHEHYVGVRHAALYWHFLDVVWIFMLGTFIALG